MLQDDIYKSNNNYYYSMARSNYSSILNYDQICRLDDVLNVTLTICGECGLPTLSITIKDFILTLKEQLDYFNFPYVDIRLNGGSATYILDKKSDSEAYRFSDVDILINMQSPLTGCQYPKYGSVYNDDEYAEDALFNNAIFCVISVIKRFMPQQPLSTAASTDSIQYDSFMMNSSLSHSNSNNNLYSGDYIKSYFRKLVRISNPKESGINNGGDSWSLVSLGESLQSRIDLKFARHIERQFEFSIDSFQIVLDSLLTFYSAARNLSTGTENMATIATVNQSKLNIGGRYQQLFNQNFYPTVIVETKWPSLTEAIQHLQARHICTINPERLRGGGLLKYCKLLVHGFTLPKSTKISLQHHYRHYHNHKEQNLTAESQVDLLERYMCSRFFIDYKETVSQFRAISNYISNHFRGSEAVLFLNQLQNVISSGSVCLMNHERQQTLNLIKQISKQSQYQSLNHNNNNSNSNNNIINNNNSNMPNQSTLSPFWTEMPSFSIITNSDSYLTQPTYQYNSFYLNDDNNFCNFDVNTFTVCLSGNRNECVSCDSPPASLSTHPATPIDSDSVINGDC